MSTQWEALAAAMERLASAETFDEVVATLCEAAPRIVGADGGKVSRKDDGHMLYLAESGPERLWLGRRIRETECFSGWCMQHGETVVVPDVASDDRIPDTAYRPAPVKSLLVLPVGKPLVVGAVAVYWRRPHDIGEAELAPLRALTQAATATIAALRRRDLASQNDAWLSMALTAGGFGVWSLDLVSDEFQVSEGAKRIFGRPAGARFTVHDLRAAIHPDEYPIQRARFERGIQQRRDLYTEYRIVWPDGSIRWLAQRGRVVSWVGNRPVRLICVVADITDIRQTRERMDRLQADIAHIGRLTEMGQMVSAFAHELRQPLTAANNYLAAARRFLVRPDTGPERTLELIEKADGQFVRANEIIERIRGFAAKADPEKRPCDVRATINEATELAKLDPKHRGVEVTLKIQRGLRPAMIDKVQIQQVLLNLLRNGFEATEIAADRRVEVEAGASEDGREIRIAVCDNGPGLSPEVMAKLFQPFVTTKDAGMGVGLSICRTIIESHGGKMWADSEPGRGAGFYFTVPAA